jgi:hypothetical protein
MVAYLHCRLTEAISAAIPGASHACRRRGREPAHHRPSAIRGTWIRAPAFPGRPAEGGPKHWLLLPRGPRDRAWPHSGRAEGVPALLRATRGGQARPRNGELAAFPWLQPRRFRTYPGQARLAGAGRHRAGKAGAALRPGAAMDALAGPEPMAGRVPGV